MASTTWTPFSVLPKAALTTSGLLQLDAQDQEVELIRRGPLELRHEGFEPMAPCPPYATRGVWTNRVSDLTLSVTTHRLVWGTADSKEARFVHLSNVQHVEAAGGPTLMHPNASFKLIVSTYTYGDLLVAIPRSSGGGGGGKDREALEQHITKAMHRKAWEMAARLDLEQQATHSLTKRRVGVDAILTKSKLKHQQAKRLASEALSGDAEQLLQEASGLLQVIHKYTALLQKQQKKKKENGGEEESADAERLSGLLHDMGMTSALTKDQVVSSGSQGNRRNKKGGGGDDSAYYELLARQVVDFIWPKLPAMGGILSLTDVFCLFNRARGTNLISPEDLRQACDVLEELDLGVSQRIFPSGIVVLQLDQQFAASDSTKLVELCPTTALEASHTLNLSPLLAFEQLEDAERQGLLCRDTTLETICFYANRFVSEEW